MNRKILSISTLAFMAIFLTGPTMAADAPALVYGSSSGLSFEVQAVNAGSVLTVSGPEGINFKESFAAGDQAFFSIYDDLGVLPDGQYTYQLVMTPKIDSATRALMDEARANGDESIVESLRAQGKIPAESQATYGYFTISGGAIVSDLVEEEGSSFEAQSGNASTGGELSNVNGAAQVFATDLIVQGSECVGVDCSTSENFGFDTSRLKENNLRLHFDDTSNSGSFPSNDWRIVANDSANGGASYLSFEDSTAGNTPFRVLAGAGNNALYVDAQGDVGLNTSNPAVELQVTDGDSPTLRLEQDGSSGFTSQTWDLAGNETNFFVRDVTHSSALPFRIFPGSGTDDALVITSDGDIGMGTDNPDAELHVTSNRTGSGGRLIVEEKMDLPVAIMAHVKSNGRGQIVMEDTSADGDTWRFRTVENVFNIDAQSTASPVEFVLNANTGDLTVLGAMNATAFNMTSDRNAKTNIEDLDSQTVLEKVAALPVSTWSYKQDAEVQHIGPMAQDFHAAFGLGPNDTSITVGDASGVALAAIKALYQQNQELMKRLAELEAQITD